MPWLGAGQDGGIAGDRLLRAAAGTAAARKLALTDATVYERLPVG